MNVLEVTGLGKSYKRYSSEWRRVLSWFGFSFKCVDESWVLRDVDLVVGKGESVGIIGQNGAGKSTLLKLITGTQKPTCGDIKILGHISAILELGMGFNPEFTGRENAIYGLGLMGCDREDIDKVITEIERFSDIGDYFDKPVRTYSSGMQMRVAFAVATAYKPDILIVDEALSVGDIDFQQRCYERIKDLQNNGTSLLFVSHSAEAIYALCERAIWINDGVISADGDVKTVLDRYQSGLLRISKGSKALVESEPGDAGNAVDADSPSQYITGDGSLEDARVSLLSCRFEIDGKDVDVINSDQRACLILEIKCNKDIEEPHVGIQIRNPRGEVIFMTNSAEMGVATRAVKSGECLMVKFCVDMILAPGEYTVTAGMANVYMENGSFKEQVFRKQNCLKFTVIKNRDQYNWVGVCNLNAKMELLDVIGVD